MNLLELILVLGTVIGIVDGQTIQVKDEAGQTTTVKLACINVPKTTDNSEQAATQQLTQLLPPLTPVVIRNTQQLENEETAAEVYVNNRSINLLLVESGNAVVDRDTIQDCAENRTQYFIAEANAKNQHWGLWQQSNSDVNQSKISTWQGKLIYEKIPPVMSVRAYQGEEFFLITNTPNQNQLVLRPSAQVSQAKLRSLQNQQVKITAVYTEGTRPNLTETACPLNADGQCMPQGEGYQVLSIVPLQPHN
ncbi:thermonuclease family protein [Nostoc sp. FACHB-110]|uniref:thermonuclease family protein n=1 Tax=Nostoc sp. FACHB-110 TaxID=2692834 RepID=UPI0016880375|nr:thermonuclease family protein [Nostoc sp. FACHB-110]MBD2436797.1 thermonuclease family protein [Nostoc sp. FACHB-110]